MRKNRRHDEPKIDFVINSFGYGNEASLKLAGKIGERGTPLVGVMKVKEMDIIDE